MSKSTPDRPKPGTAPAASRDSSNTVWLVGGVVAALILIAFIVAALSTGTKESPEGISETAEVTVTGVPLPTYPGEGLADPAIGMAMPEISGVSFDGTPVSITNDGRAKVVILLTHW